MRGGRKRRPPSSSAAGDGTGRGRRWSSSSPRAGLDAGLARLPRDSRAGGHRGRRGAPWLKLLSLPRSHARPGELSVCPSVTGHGRGRVVRDGHASGRRLRDGCGAEGLIENAHAEGRRGHPSRASSRGGCCGCTPRRTRPPLRRTAWSAWSQARCCCHPAAAGSCGLNELVSHGLSLMVVRLYPLKKLLERAHPRDGAGTTGLGMPASAPHARRWRARRAAPSAPAAEVTSRARVPVGRRGPDLGERFVERLPGASAGPPVEPTRPTGSAGNARRTVPPAGRHACPARRSATGAGRWTPRRPARSPASRHRRPVPPAVTAWPAPASMGHAAGRLGGQGSRRDSAAAAVGRCQRSLRVISRPPTNSAQRL